MARPIAAADFVVTQQNTSIDIYVLNNDQDPDSDPIKVRRIRRGPSNGSAVVQNGSYVIYTPNTGFIGGDSFQYEIRDEPTSGPSRTARAWCYITVNTQSPPTAFDDSGITPTNTSLNINTDYLILNDTDPDNDPLSVVSVQNPVNGSVTMTGSIITFTPANNFAGNGSFTYTIDDGQGGTDTATVNITIPPGPNPPPTANPDAFSTNENVSLQIPVSSLLSNDTDPDNDTLSVISVQNAVNGTATLSGSMVTFTPAPNFNGTGAFDYTVSDGHGGTSSTNVAITILRTSASFWNNGEAAALQNKATTYDVTPDTNSANPGALSNTSKQDFIQYLSEIRALHGLSACEFDNGAFNYDAEQQASSLYMSANSTLTHSPLPGNPCYSINAHTGASEANLGSLNRSARALNSWMRDNGISTAWDLGHRTWILNPGLGITAYGEVSNFSSMRSHNHPLSGHQQPQVIACPQPGTDYPFELFNGNWHYSSSAITTYDNPIVTVYEHGTGNIPVSPGFNGHSSYGNVRILAWYAAVTAGKTYDITIQTSNMPDITYSVNVISIV